MLPKKNQWVLEIVFIGHVCGWFLAAILIATDYMNHVPMTANLVFHQIGKCLGVVGGGSIVAASTLYWFMVRVLFSKLAEDEPVPEKKAVPRIACAMSIEESYDESRHNSKTPPYVM